MEIAVFNYTGLTLTLEISLSQRVTSFILAYIVKSLEIFLLLNNRTMATIFIPVLGVICFKLIPKYCNV